MTSDDKYLEDSTYDAILAAVAVALRCIPAKALTHGIQQLDRREIVGPLVNPSAWLASNGFKAHRLAMKTLQGALVMRTCLEQQDKELHGTPNIVEEAEEAPERVLFLLAQYFLELAQKLAEEPKVIIESVEKKKEGE